MLTKDYFSLLNALERVGNVPYIGPADVQSISGFIKGGGTGSGGGGGGAQ
jgi:hypothetical protein